MLNTDRNKFLKRAGAMSSSQEGAGSSRSSLNYSQRSSSSTSARQSGISSSYSAYETPKRIQAQPKPLRIRNASTPLRHSDSIPSPGASPIQSNTPREMPARPKTSSTRTLALNNSQSGTLPRPQYPRTPYPAPSIRSSQSSMPTPLNTRRTLGYTQTPNVSKQKSVSFRTPNNQIMRGGPPVQPSSTSTFSMSSELGRSSPVLVEIVQPPLPEPYDTNNIDEMITTPQYFHKPLVLTPSIIGSDFKPYRQLKYLKHLAMEKDKLLSGYNRNINKEKSLMNRDKVHFNTTRFYNNQIGIPMFYFKRHTSNSEYIRKKSKYKELYYSDYIQLAHSSYVSNPWILEFIFPALRLDNINISHSFRVYPDIVDTKWDITLDELDHLVRNNEFIKRFIDTFEQFARFWGFNAEKNMLGRITFTKNENFRNKLELVMSEPITYFKIFTRVLILLYAFQQSSHGDAFLYILKSEFYKRNHVRTTVFMYDCLQVWSAIPDISVLPLPRDTNLQFAGKMSKRVFKYFYSKLRFLICAFVLFEVYRISNHMGVLPEDFILPGHIYKEFYGLHSDLPISFKSYVDFINKLSPEDLNNISSINIGSLQQIDYNLLIQEKGQVSLENIPGYKGESTVMGKLGRYVSKELLQHPQSIEQIYNNNIIQNLSNIENRESASQLKNFYKRVPRVLTMPLDILQKDIDYIKENFSVITDPISFVAGLLIPSAEPPLKMLTATNEYNKNMVYDELTRGKKSLKDKVSNMYYSYMDIFIPQKIKSKHVMLNKSLENEIIKIMKDQLSKQFSSQITQTFTPAPVQNYPFSIQTTQQKLLQ